MTQQFHFQIHIQENYKHKCPLKIVHGVQSSTIHDSPKVETNRWMDKQNVVYNTMECYVASRRKEILSHATTCMNLDDIMLREISQSQKDIVWSHLYEASKVVQFIEIETRMVVTRDCREWGNGSCCTMSTGFEICKIRKFWRSASQHCKYT